MLKYLPYINIQYTNDFTDSTFKKILLGDFKKTYVDSVNSELVVNDKIPLQIR